MCRSSPASAGITVPASAPAGTVCPDISTLNTAAGSTLVSITLYWKRTAAERLTDLFVNAGCMADTKSVQIDLLSTGDKRQTKPFCRCRKDLGKPDHLVKSTGTTQRGAILIHKTECTATEFLRK